MGRELRGVGPAPAAEREASATPRAAHPGPGLRRHGDFLFLLPALRAAPPPSPGRVPSCRPLRRHRGTSAASGLVDDIWLYEHSELAQCASGARSSAHPRGPLRRRRRQPRHSAARVRAAHPRRPVARRHCER